MAKDAKGHGSESRGIASITGASTTMLDGQLHGSVSWKDHGGRTGTTSGLMDNAHMQALMARAGREGITDRNAAGALAQGHPKSAPVAVHPAIKADNDAAISRLRPAYGAGVGYRK